MVGTVPALVVKRGDTAPAFKAQCMDGTTPVNITGATARLLLRRHGTTATSLTLTVVDATTGKVRHNWAVGELAFSGTYSAEVEVTFADNTVQTFPGDGYATILVYDDLG